MVVQVREVLLLRVPPALKREVEEYARLKGISANSAGILLITDGLRAERRRA